jgi:GDPmannose 4,6-dehydratase
MMSAECNFARQIARIEKGLQDPIILHGNLESIRTWADVRDAVRAYWLLVRKCRPGEVYNIGGKTTKTIGEVLDYLISLSPMKDKIQKKQDPKLMRPYDVTLQIPDCYKFLEETGWQRTIKFEQTMQDLLNWWREYEI